MHDPHASPLSGQNSELDEEPLLLDGELLLDVELEEDELDGT